MPLLSAMRAPPDSRVAEFVAADVEDVEGDVVAFADLAEQVLRRDDASR